MEKLTGTREPRINMVRRILISINRSIIYWNNEMNNTPVSRKKHRNMIGSALMSNANDKMYWEGKYLEEKAKLAN